jgi:uncharacterized membrane protein YeaQ/YmgE (transglycosylase-associated protein family)
MTFLEISSFNIFLWLIVGISAGYYSHRYHKHPVSGGLAITLCFAIFGALTSGYLASFLTGKAMLGVSF